MINNLKSNVSIIYRNYSLKSHLETIKKIKKICKKKGLKFPQNSYDELFNCVENNLRELGFGDVGVNKKMKDLNKILYDILLKISTNKNDFLINEKLVLKYFVDLNNSKVIKYDIFNQYFTDFYHFCFVLPSETMLKDALKFKV